MLLCIRKLLRDFRLVNKRHLIAAFLLLFTTYTSYTTMHYIYILTYYPNIYRHNIHIHIIPIKGHNYDVAVFLVSGMNSTAFGLSKPLFFDKYTGTCEYAVSTLRLTRSISLYDSSLPCPSSKSFHRAQYPGSDTGGANWEPYCRMARARSTCDLYE